MRRGGGEVTLFISTTGLQCTVRSGLVCETGDVVGILYVVNAKGSPWHIMSGCHVLGAFRDSSLYCAPTA